MKEERADEADNPGPNNKRGQYTEEDDEECMPETSKLRKTTVEKPPEKPLTKSKRKNKGQEQKGINEMVKAKARRRDDNIKVTTQAQGSSDEEDPRAKKKCRDEEQDSEGDDELIEACWLDLLGDTTFDHHPKLPGDEGRTKAIKARLWAEAGGTREEDHRIPAAKSPASVAEKLPVRILASESPASVAENFLSEFWLLSRPHR